MSTDVLSSDVFVVFIEGVFTRKARSKPVWEVWDKLEKHRYYSNSCFYYFIQTTQYGF